MKVVSIALFLFFFVATPAYLLNTMVMPELSNLKNVYGNADQMAARAVAK